MPVNIRHLIIELIVRLSGCGHSGREIPRNVGVSQCAISKVLRCVPATDRTTAEATCASIEEGFTTKRPWPSTYHDEKCIFLSAQDRGGLIKQKGRHVSVRMVQRHLVAVYIVQDVWPNASGWLLTITTTTACGHEGTWSGTTSTVPMWYLLLRLGSTFNTLMVVSELVNG